MLTLLKSIALIVALLIAAGQSMAEEGKLRFKTVDELPSFPTARDLNLDLSESWRAAAEGDLDIGEQNILAAINRWNSELYPHNALANQAYLLAVLMDPVTADISRELIAATAGCAGAGEKARKICEWTMSHMSHTQQHPKFANFPGNDPWGVQNLSRRPTYRKLLPSEMAAMKIHTDRISGKCMTLAHLIGGVFLQLGVAPDDLLFLHMQLKNYTHGVALIRYEGELLAVNNMAVVPAPFKNGTNPSEMELLVLYNHQMQIPLNVVVAAGILDSTLLASSPTVVEGFLDNCRLSARLADSRYPIDCELGDPHALSRYIMESGRNSELACLAKYAYQSLYVKHPGYYLTASLRTSPPRDLASQLDGVDSVLVWIKNHIADGSIFPDGQARLMTADQVLVFQQGSPKDKAVLAYTILRHRGFDPAVVLTGSDGYIELAGTSYSLSTGRAATVPEKEIVFRLKAVERFPGLDRTRIEAREMITNGNIPGVLEALEAAARSYPDSWQIQEDLSMAYQNLNQPGKARSHMEKADGLDPDNPERLNRLAWMALEQQDPAAAVRYCVQGLRLEPENGYLKSNLVQGYIWTGRLAEARAYCEAQARVQLRGKPFRVVVRDDIEALSNANPMTDDVRDFAKSLQD